MKDLNELRNQAYRGDGAVYRPVVPVPSGPRAELLPVPEVRCVGCLSGQHRHHRNLYLRIYGRIQFIVYGRERRTERSGR